MLKMYHPEFEGAGTVVESDVLLVHTDGLVSLKILFFSVVNVRPIIHLDFSAVVFSLIKNRLYTIQTYLLSV